MEIETFHYLGGMLHFGETFDSRIGAWIDQIEAKTPFDQISGSGQDGLRAQEIIEGAITSWEEQRFVDV
jgi:hypothetical protein